jgi:hypothetical protein
VLPTVSNPAVLELEDEAVVNIQLLAVPLRGVVMKAYHAAVVTSEQVLQCGLEGSLPSLPHTGRLGQRSPRGPCGRQRGGLAPACATRRSRVEDLGERLHVGRVEGLVTPSHGLGVFFCLVYDVVLLGCDR